MKKLKETLFASMPPATARIAAAGALGVAVLAAAIGVFQEFSISGEPGQSSTMTFARTSASLMFAYLTAVLVRWCLILKSCAPSWMLMLVARIGAVASLLHVLYSIAAGQASLALIVAHIGNLAFWLCMENMPREKTFKAETALVPLCTFAVAVVAIYVIHSEQNRLRTEQLARENYQSQNTLDRSSKVKVNEVEGESGGRNDATTVTKTSPVADESPSNSVDAIRAHRRGPAKAKVRLVLYVDYENKNCRQISTVISELLKLHSDSISLTVRHYPEAANGVVPLESILRPEACRAALLVEAAVKVRGDEAFWPMHELMLSTETEPKDWLATSSEMLKLDKPQELQEALQSPQILSRVLSDVMEARAKGIQSAPALLVNGTRLSQLDDAAISKTIEAALGLGLTPASPQIAAIERAVDPSATALVSADQQQAAALACVRVTNPSDRAAGSGVVFAVRGTFVYALTAAHIVKNARTVEVQTFSKESYPNPSGTYSWSAVVAVSAVSDIAVVRFSARESAPQPLKMASLSAVSTASDACITCGCDAVDSPPSCQSNEILSSKRWKRSASDPDSLMWETQRASKEGRSGGPLLNSQLSILGIASGNSDGKGYFSHAKEVYRLLSDNGLENLIDGT